ncbi:helix-turn-helix transcriptional regulator [Brevundimonas sp. NPDC092305]|uniref:helix-turn-helix transcriptional regulator n=1 Tax=Brevundimonas sp. NPDC092305 TaxID=3363957 RepID=UPI003814998C
MSWQIAGEPIESGGRDDRLLQWSAVRDIAGISRTTAWRMQQTGDFPRPVPISPNRVAWWESELNAWKASRNIAPHIRPKPFKPPRAPRLIVTGRSRRPDRAEPQAPQIEPPPQPPSTPPQSRRRGRKSAAPPNQIDFGF